MSNSPIGLMVCRTDYSDEGKWNRFMSYLDHQAHHGLVNEGQGTMIQYLDWKFQVGTSVMPRSISVTLLSRSLIPNSKTRDQ